MERRILAGHSHPAVRSLLLVADIRVEHLEAGIPEERLEVDTREEHRQAAHTAAAHTPGHRSQAAVVAERRIAVAQVDRVDPVEDQNQLVPVPVEPVQADTRLVDTRLDCLGLVEERRLS